MVIKQELIEDFDMVSSPVFPPKFVEIPASPVKTLFFILGQCGLPYSENGYYRRFIKTNGK